MSKQAKSKNSTIKKAKKLERQGKYIKALKVCDDYLDNERTEEILIQLKIDILVNLYNNDNFINEINENKTKITDFIEKSEEEELLKLYNTLDNYLELNSHNMADERKVGTYLAGGLLVDNLETILVLNEMAKDNKNESKPQYPADDDLKDFVENVKKTSYQYLDLILPNALELMAKSNFNFEGIISKIRQFLEPKKTDDNAPTIEKDLEKPAGNIPNTIEKDIEKPAGNIPNTIEKDIEKPGRNIPNTIEKDLKEPAEDIANTMEETNSLKLEDNTELSTDYSIEDEIKGLKEIITYLNDKNEFKKALIYQRRLVKLAREENIKAEHEPDSKQKTLSDY